MPESEGNIMSKTLKLVISALMASMACVATIVIKIPIPATGGYINLGDSIVLLAGVALGPVYGGLAAGLGSALADLLGGYVVFAPATFLIKALMAVVMGLIIRTYPQKQILRFVFAGIVSEIIMILGYFAFEATIMGYGLAATGAIPGNAIQGTAGIVIATMLMPILGKLNLAPLRKDKPAPKRRNDEQ